MNYNYLDAKNKQTNKTLINSPRHTYLVDLTFYREDWDFTASVWTKIVRDMYDNNEYINYHTVNASVSKTWKDKYTLTASIDNIFDSIDEHNFDYVDYRRWLLSYEMKF